MSFKYRSYRKWSVGRNINDSVNIGITGTHLPPPRSDIQVYYYNIQTSSLKLLGQSKPTLCGTLLGRGMKVYINYQSHMTKMATMAINSKDLQTSSSLLLQNRKRYDFETLREASGRRALKC